MTQHRESIIQQIVNLVNSSDSNEAHFFSTQENHKWLEDLAPLNFFKKETIKPKVINGDSYYYPNWPQGNYLEKIAKKIHTGVIQEEKSINLFVSVLRDVFDERDNLWAIRSIFRSTCLVPAQYLTVQDVTNCFEMIKEISKQNNLIEFDVHESIFHLLENVKNNDHDRSVLKEYLKQLFRSDFKKEFGFREKRLVFFKEHRFRHFSQKFFEKQLTHQDFVTEDCLEVSSKLLNDLLRLKDVDVGTASWRPAVVDDRQNQFHDSAPSVLTGINFELAKILMCKGKIPKEVSLWKKSNYLTFTRIYIALAGEFTSLIPPEECAHRLLEIGLQYHFRHEAFHFLKKHFEKLKSETQEKILDSIDALEDKYSEENDKRKPLFTSAKKMRWLQALKNSTNARAKKLYEDNLKITKIEIEHPDYNSFMGPTIIGPSSPMNLDDFSRCESAQELLDKILSFKEKKDHFGEPSIEGLSRTFEEYVVKDPVRCGALIKDIEKLPRIYTSSLFDGYTKSWSNKGFVPVEDLLNLAYGLFQNQDYIHELKDKESKSRWAATSIFRFISAGVRDDKHAFDKELNPICLNILKLAVKSVLPSEDYKGSSDAQTRAINEPRGVLFESAILLALREARLVYDKKNEDNSRQSSEFKEAWENLYSLIEEPLGSKNILEVSLHAHLGSYYRQISFLNSKWIYENIDMVCPSESSLKPLWSAFMQGFCYVNVCVKEMYQALHSRGHLLGFLRYPDEKENKQGSRIGTLQERIIALALISYLHENESLENGLVGEILKFEDDEEWSRLIRAIPQITGEKPKKGVLKQAKKLVSHILEKFDSLGDKILWRKKLGGIGWVLKLFNDPNEEAVRKIVQIASYYTNSSWDHYEIIEYLKSFKDAYPEMAGKLFLELVKSGPYCPSYPEEDIKALCMSLKENYKALLAQICHEYSTKAPHNPLTKAINDMLI